MVRRFFSFVFSLMLCALALLLIASPVFAAEVIKDIEVEGCKLIEPEAVLAHMQLKPGDMLDADALDQDLRSLWATGFFQDIRIEAERTADGVILIVKLKENPRVREYRFEGNKKLSNDKILEVFDLKPSSVYNEGRIQENILKIRRLYADEGYSLAEVSFEVTSWKELAEKEGKKISPAESEDVVVIIKISEHRKVAIRQIIFRGNKAFSNEELLEVLKSKQAHSLSWLTGSGYFREEMVEADFAILDQFYRNSGYIDVVVSRPIVTSSVDRKFVYLSFQVKEGDQYKVGNVKVSGELLFTEDEHKKELELESQMVFSQSKFETDIKTIRARYTDIGYAFAEVKPSMEKRAGEKIVDITYTVTRGRLAYIERIDITGNDRTRDKVVRRELVISEGDLYSGPKIRRSKTNLLRLGFFESVEIKTERGSTPSSVRLIIQIKERLTGSFVIGAGFSSLENLFATAQISVANLFGTGQKVSLTAEIGQIRKDISLNYLYPYFLDTNWILGLYLLYSDRDYETFDRLERSIRGRLGYPLGWDTTGYASYGVHFVEVSNFKKELKYFMQLEEGKTNTTSIEWSLVRSTVDNPYFPTRGSDNRVTLEWASESFGGDINYMKYLAQTRWYFPFKTFGEKWMPVLMINGEGGYIQSLDDGPVPLSERFFLGGLNSVRGFRYKTLGPYESDVFPLSSSEPTSRLMEVSSNVGGDKYLQGNAEFLFPIVPSVGVRGLLFYDVGNAFDEGESIELDLLRQSWGFGIRWFSPIGPLRFEWGFPLYPKEDEERQVFEFGVGSFF